MSSLRNFLAKLNVFESSHDETNEENERDRRFNTIATQIFFILLFVTLMIVGVVFGVISEVTTVTLSNPTKDQLQSLSADAYCPCSRISLPFREFVSIETTFHQVCSSIFISDRWIEAINSGSNSTYFYALDFRTDGSSIFQSLSSFCRLSKDNVAQRINAFNQKSLISSTVFSQLIFETQVNASIEQLQSTVSNQFLTLLQSVRTMILDYQFFSGLQTNAFQRYYPVTAKYVGLVYVYLYLQSPNNKICNCATDIDCSVVSMITNLFGQASQITVTRNTQVLMEIVGFAHSCFPVNSILLSTFECFYNQTCLNQLLSFFSTTEKFQAMTLSNQTRFNSNSTMKTILDNLMIEDWITNVSYEKYYQQCAPLSCTYSKNEKHDWLFVLTKLIGLLGGLTLVLTFIIQNIIGFIRRPRDAQPLTFLRMKRLLKKICLEVNLFKHHGSNEQQITYQRMGTRFYIISLLIITIILSFYTFLIENIHQKTVLHPSEVEYNELEETYAANLFCSCSTISLPYSIFLNIETFYHQLCTSDLVSDQWNDYVSNLTSMSYEYLNDYRLNAPFQFQLLRMFCQQARQTVDDSLRTFLQTPFLSSQIIPQDLFQSKINSSISDWKSQTLGLFLRTIQLFQAITHGNQLISSSRNAGIYVTNDTTRQVKIAFIEYPNCSCALSSSCVAVMGMFDTQYTSYYVIPNFFAGCFPVDALQQSTLECFYNLSCMIGIDKYLVNSRGSSFNFSNLNPNLSSPYETIGSIINKLMIDSWPFQISYSSYYETCSPASCTYEYMSRNNILTVITTIVAVFGGLSLGLKILTLIILRFIEKIKNNLFWVGLLRTMKNTFVFHTQQQLIHRLHFCFLLITLCVLFILTTFQTKSITVQLNKPSLSTYQQLFNRYNDSLQCSCSQISFPHESFLTIVPGFHHLCQSEFISSEWISYLYGSGDLSLRFNLTDYRTSAPGQFVLLASLCELSQETVNNALLQLLTNDFISSQLLSSNFLDEQIQTIINQFQITTQNSFLNILNLIREIIGSNMIISAWATNWFHLTDRVIQSGWTTHTAPVNYDGCDCLSSWKCTQPSRGMMSGCYALEALLQTTLRCFYNQDCIDDRQTFSPLNISTLETSHFQLNSTIQSILNQLMVEQYQTNFSYEQYFEKCSPSSCTYSYITNHDAIEVPTSLISLYGGLTILTQCAAVIIAKLYYDRRNAINPDFVQ